MRYTVLSVQLCRQLFAFLLLFMVLRADAALVWQDNASPPQSWRTGQEACWADAVRTLNSFRAASPAVLFRIAEFQIGSSQGFGQYDCAFTIQQFQFNRWLPAVGGVIRTEVYAVGSGDPCPLDALFDPETGLCGSPKCNGPCAPTGCAVPNPINHATGTKFWRDRDYAGVGQHALQFERFYASRDLANAGMGRTWRHSYAAMLVVLSDGSGGSVRAFRPDGRRLTFTIAGGTASAEADVSERLVIVPQSGGAPPRWRLIDLDDRTETYSAEGRLESIADRAGQTISIVYRANGQIDYVRDQFNRRLTFGHDAAGRIASITDSAGAITTYGYDAQGRLSTVTRPDGRVRTYLYNEPLQTAGADLPDALTGLIDETGQRYATWTYDAQGRATSSRLGSGANTQRYQVTYNANGTSTVTDPLGTARTYTSAVSFGVARLQHVSQPCATCGGSNVQAQTFDANGNVASRTDFNGNRTNLTYDLARNLETLRVEGLTAASATSPRTRTTTRQWHPTWRLPARIAEPKRITLYFYNGDSDGGTPLTCGATGALCRMRVHATNDQTGALGFAAAFTGTPREWNYTYNALGQKLTEDGPRTDVADTTTWVHNATTGNLTEQRNALAHLTQFTSYDGNGRPLSLTDPNGVITTFTYDWRGLLRTRTLAGQTTTFAYTETGRLRRVTLGDGSWVEYGYDAAQRLTTLTDTLGQQRIYTRDDAGNVTREETFNADGTPARVRNRSFDALGRLSADIGAAGQTTGYTYDSHGNLRTVTDPRSTPAVPLVTTRDHDELNRLTQITDAASPAGQTRFTYDGLDQLLTVRAPNNATTTYTVDGLGNVTQEVSPDRGTTGYTHDAAGNVRTRTDARGITATYSYDALNRLTGITYPTAGENVTLTWDSAAGCANGIGRLCQVTDAGGTTRHGYDARGNLVEVVRIELGQTYTTRFTYTLADRIATVATPTGKTVTLGRDALGQVQSLSGSVAGAATVFVQQIAYRGDGQLASQLLGSLQTEAIARDTDGLARGTALTEPPTAANEDIPLPPWALALLAAALLAAVYRQQQQAHGAAEAGRRLLAWTLLTTLSASLTVLPRQVWAVDLARGYDANNNLTSRTTAAGTTTYTYDALNRLRSEAGPARTQTFGYDPNGNRTSDGSGTYVPAASSNRYGTIRSSTASYDAAGNLTSLATGSPLTTRTFTYNQAGRLAEVRQGGVLLASYTYNANGQRSRKTLTPQGAQALGLPAVALTIVFHYDTSGNLLAETSSSGTPIRTYVWREAASGPLAETLLDHPVAQIEHANNVALGGSNGTATEAVLYLRTDELATPREARNAAGTVVWSWYSAAFGDTSAAEDPDGNGQRTIVNLRFPGQYADQEAGLHYNWHRSYDPATGRYLESDPIGLAGGVNTYTYTGASPLVFADQTGLVRCRPVGFLIVCDFGPPPQLDPGLPLEPVLPPRLPTPDLRSLCLIQPLLCLLPSPFNPLTSGRTCREQTPDDCRVVAEKCRRDCTDVFVDDPNALPGSGRNFGIRLQRCIRECLDANGCGGYFLR
jgi:RHS repeat-associated protein